MATYNATLTNDQPALVSATREPRVAIVVNATATKPPRVIASDAPIVRR